MQEIYFDNAATVKPYAEVLEVYQKIETSYFANTSSNHRLGMRSSQMLEKARGQIAKYLKVEPEEVYFTSGASEGNNAAIKGVAYHNKGWARRIITSQGEHPSVLEVFKELEKEGFEVIYLPYDQEGQIDLEMLKNSIDEHTSLVSIMAVNNEVGYRYNIEEISKIVKNTKAKLHVDATQAIGKETLPSPLYDLMTFSGHKIGGLKGSGALIKKKNVEMESLILGGGQEHHLRAGTSALALDCALATALRLSLSSREERRAKAEELHSYLREELIKIPEIKILSPLNATPFILSFAFTKHKGSIIAEALSNEGIYVSTKSACSSKEDGYSYVIRNAGYDSDIASNAIRVSFSGKEDISEAKRFIEVLLKLLSEIRIKE